MKEVLEEISERCARAVREEPEKYFLKGGLLHCRKCGTPKQFQIPNTDMIVYCSCKCEMDEYNRIRGTLKAQTTQSQREAVRDACFPTLELYNCRFENDNGQGDRTIFQRCRNYAENFHECYENNNGILLYGNSGVGKSFLAGCIANHVIDNGYTAMITSVSRVRNQLWNAENKQAFMDSFATYDLLIIDDFGLENRSDYTNEIATNLLEVRCGSQKPMIITSNLAPDGLKQSDDIDRERILSRILGRCVPIKYIGEDRRRNRFMR